MKQYPTDCEMMIRQVESVETPSVGFKTLLLDLKNLEAGLKIIIYFKLCDKIETHHWQTNFFGTWETFNLQVKKLALARFMGLSE